MIDRREFCLSFGAALLLPKRIVAARSASVADPRQRGSYVRRHLRAFAKSYLHND